MKHAYRSNFERDIAVQIRNRKVPLRYEALKVKYQKPMSFYKPDWVLPNHIIIETKGRFTAQDRAKHLLIQEQHPNLDIRFVFQNAKVRLSKASKTTYGDWATKNNFKWSQQWIPDEWFNEPPTGEDPFTTYDIKKKK